MNTPHFGLGHDLDPDLLIRAAAGVCTPDERSRVEQWAAGSAERRATVQAIRGVLVRSHASLNHEWKATARTALQRHIVEAQPNAATRVLRVTPSVRRSSVARAATVALIVGGSVVGAYFVGRSSSTGAPTAGRFGASAGAVTAALGQRVAFRLSDGTMVMLAPGSTLRPVPGYGGRDRVVDLAGEAAFTVTHDAKRPFIVRSPRAEVRDLGTRFVVRAYDTDSVTEVAVAEGLVEVRGTRAGAYERIRVDAAGRLASGRVADLDPYFAWTGGRLVFRDTPLHEAAARLSRWYDIDVQLAPGINGLRLDASFQEESAAHALRIVAAVLRLDIAQIGRTYTLRPK